MLLYVTNADACHCMTYVKIQAMRTLVSMRRKIHTQLCRHSYAHISMPLTVSLLAKVPFTMLLPWVSNKFSICIRKLCLWIVQATCALQCPMMMPYCSISHMQMIMAGILIPQKRPIVCGLHLWFETNLCQTARI